MSSDSFSRQGLSNIYPWILENFLPQDKSKEKPNKWALVQLLKWSLYVAVDMGVFLAADASINSSNSA